MKLDADLIQGFVGSVLRKTFDQAVKSPDVHREWWELCTSDARYVAIAAPRGHAKSTAITFAYVLAAILFRDRDFAIIVSDTEGQSILFLNDIKKEILENEDIIGLFGVEKLEKDSETDIIIRFKDGHRARVMAKGSEQKVRGLKWRGKRPNLIVGDDLENDEIVMNPERREKFRRWVYGALLPCISADGIVRIVGTILHLDSFLERLMPQMLSKWTKEEGLKVWSENKRNVWKTVKYRAHNSDYSLILWPERFNKERLKQIQRDYIDQGMPDVYNQEYLNNPIDESRAIFKRSDLIPLTEKEFEKLMNGSIPLNYYIGTDFAVSDKRRADWSVFVVAGLDNEGILYILDVIRDRMDTREIVDTFMKLQDNYKPAAFAVEKGTITHAIGPFLREEMFRRQSFLPLEEFTPSVDKTERARSIQGRVRMKGVRFFKEGEWWSTFEEEITTFPRSRHDDQVDAFGLIGLCLDKLVYAPTRKELLEDEWEDEMRRSELNEDGRSAVTGY